MRYQYWDEKTETMPRGELEALQLDALRAASPGAGDHLQRPQVAAAGIRDSSDIRSLTTSGASRSRPNTTCGNPSLRHAGRAQGGGRAAARLERHNGVPTISSISPEGHLPLVLQHGPLHLRPGCTSADVFQNMITYGIFTGGLGPTTAPKR